MRRSRGEALTFASVNARDDGLGPPTVVEGEGALLQALRPRLLYAVRMRPNGVSYYEWSWPRLDEVLAVEPLDADGQGYIVVRDHLHRRRVRMPRHILQRVPRALTWQLEGPRRRLRVWTRPEPNVFYQLGDGRVVSARGGSAANLAWFQHGASVYGYGWLRSPLPLVPRLVRRYSWSELLALVRKARTEGLPLPVEVQEP